MKTFFRSYWKSILLVSLIAYASLVREIKVPIQPNSAFADKWVHIFLYCILTLALIWDTSKAQQTRKWKLFWCLLFPIFYGGLLEILQQKFFPPRTGDWYDWLADIVGMLVAVGIGTLAKKLSNGRNIYRKNSQN